MSRPPKREPLFDRAAKVRVLGRDGYEWAPHRLTQDELKEATRLYWKGTRWGLTRCSSDKQRAAADQLRRAPRPTGRPRFDRSRPGLNLDGTYDEAVDHGDIGELVVAFHLGCDLEPDAGAKFDIRAADGTRLDVKTSRADATDLMIPLADRAKVDPDRVDGFVLVKRTEIAGCISTGRFLKEHKVQGPPRFLIPTMYVPATRLSRIPERFIHRPQQAATGSTGSSEQAEDPATPGTDVTSDGLT